MDEEEKGYDVAVDAAEAARIDQLAARIWRGDFGNGHEARRAAIGEEDYEKVRARVNDGYEATKDVELPDPNSPVLDTIEVSEPTPSLNDALDDGKTVSEYYEGLNSRRNTLAPNLDENGELIEDTVSETEISTSDEDHVTFEEQNAVDPSKTWDDAMERYENGEPLFSLPSVDEPVSDPSANTFEQLDIDGENLTSERESVMDSLAAQRPYGQMSESGARVVGPNGAADSMDAKVKQNTLAPNVSKDASAFTYSADEPAMPGPFASGVDVVEEPEEVKDASAFMYSSKSPEVLSPMMAFAPEAASSSSVESEVAPSPFTPDDTYDNPFGRNQSAPSGQAWTPNFPKFTNPDGSPLVVPQTDGEKALFNANEFFAQQAQRVAEAEASLD